MVLYLFLIFFFMTIKDNQEEIIELFANCIDEGLLNKDRGNIQTIMYGIGSCAKRFSKEVFGTHSETFISAIYKVIDAPDSKTSKNITSTENAVSSLFRMCIYKSDEEYITNEHLIKSLQNLPLISEEDEDEARSINGLFLKKLKEDGNSF